MKNKKTVIFRLLILMGCVFLFFPACSSGSDDDENMWVDDEDAPSIENPSSAHLHVIDHLVISQADWIKFYSLTTGREIAASKRNTKEWDIAVEVASGFCSIYTNSGDTAALFGSGGAGGVWYTNKQIFSDVEFNDRVVPGSGGEYEAYVRDVTRWAAGMSGSAAVRMNIMTYYGYESGTGLSLDTAFTLTTGAPFSQPFYLFNKKAFAYVDPGMPPVWHPEEQVYIIRHADGVSYSKFQVSSLAYGSSRFSLDMKFIKLPLMIPGTYTGTGRGYGGDISISAILSESGITQITVTTHQETSSRANVVQALTDIPQSILDDQALAVDVISGATFTSKGIIKAVEDCVFQAGGEDMVNRFKNVFGL
jgi:uncharacterized protein with FMN-binding domain